MTPFRSFVVTSMTAMTLTIMALLKFKGGTITYVIVSQVAYIEGSMQVKLHVMKACLCLVIAHEHT